MENNVRAPKLHVFIHFIFLFNSSENKYQYKKREILYFCMEIMNVSM